MTTISSVSSAWSSASVQRASRPGPSPERLLSKIDADGSGGVDSTELQGLLDKVAKKTGTTSDTSATDLLTQYDANGDGNLNADELGKTMESIMPARSTMDFAQSRNIADGTDSTSAATGEAGDDLFGKVDSDGDGAVSKTELQALLEAMSGGTASQTGVSSDDAFAALDTDGDGSLTQAEFDAGRPSGDGAQAGGMPPGGAGGPRGAGGPGGAGGAGGTSETTTYDPLDTNEDGVVSLTERLAGATSTTEQDAVTALFSAIDTDGDKTISASESKTFIDQLTSQFASAAAASSSLTSSSLTSSTSASSTDSQSSASKDSSQRGDLVRLADLARRRYEQAANDFGSRSSTEALSAVA